MMKKFIICDHRRRENIILAYFSMMCIMIVLRMINCLTLTLVLLFHAIMLLLIILFKKGLYIEDGEYYYKFFTKKKINIQEIVALKICESVWEYFDSFYYRLKDAEGNQLYTFYFLKEINDEILRFKGNDEEFCFVHRKHIMFQTICDQELLELLKEQNPNMLIIDYDNITGKNEAIMPDSSIPSIKSNDAQEIALYYKNLTPEQCSPMEINWYDGGQRNRQWIITFTDDKEIYHYVRINADTGEVIQDSHSVR